MQEQEAGQKTPLTSSTGTQTHACQRPKVIATRTHTLVLTATRAHPRVHTPRRCKREDKVLVAGLTATALLVLNCAVLEQCTRGHSAPRGIGYGSVEEMLW